MLKLKDIQIALNVQSQIAEIGTKLHASLLINVRRYSLLLEKDYNKVVEREELRLALIDKYNKLLYISGNYVFSMEGSEELIKIKRILFDKKYKYDFVKTDINMLSDSEKEKIAYIDSKEKRIISNFIIWQ
jgi:hypothetical protein